MPSLRLFSLSPLVRPRARFDLATLLLFAACICACGDGDGMPLERDASAATTRDAAHPWDFDAEVDPQDEEPLQPAPDADEDEDAAEDAGEEVPDADEPDASACADDQPADACGVCGGDGASCAHPLAGRYAVRTQLYARQKAIAEDSELDLVSKGVLVSVADIDAQGAVREHYCLLELASTDSVYSWTVPATVELIPDTTIQLLEQDGKFVRPLAEHHAYLSWSPQGAPADCVAGQMHANGCRCPSGTALPVSADDCRVTDIDQDAVPGGAMYIGFEPVVDPTVAGTDLKLNLVLQFSLEWRLDAAATQGPLVGTIAGGLEQSVLSLSGELASLLGGIKNAVCSPDLGHVELVKGDFSCASLLAGRATNAETYGIFNTALDGEPPAVSACPDPNCGVDADRDGSPDCEDGCPGDATKTAAGTCGCGVPETNTDGDAALDCTDGCPSDAAKLAPGTCGCGVPETNADGDALPDCTDECDADGAKTAAGSCGCGVPETNTDGDSMPDCTDECDGDPGKTAPGACGCGVADTNSDSDATPDCTDQCDTDSSKTAPGTCGCGVADEDRDGDGLASCNDACPDDRNKTTLGQCGCGVAETNTDGDSMPDCTDQCDSDAAKTAPGPCGCGVAETNTDGDAAPDCTDECDSDAAKTAAGACGCGVAETNTDGDSAPDCTDQCDSDAAKTAPGTCGCGVAETNTDGDSMPDCTDQCDSDAAKTAPGTCGCGVAETNTDGDSMPDCTDQCDSDAAKTAPGTCGCGVADRDLNGDGSIDCQDQCPADPNKVAPGICGCGVPDTNTDGDSRVDCQDECDTDAAKIAAGQCGCGAADTDADGDGVANCNDACPNDRAKTTLGLCGCGVADTNTDGDAAPDCTDQCDADPAKTAPGACGCGVADTNTDGDSAPDCTDQCDADAAKTAPGTCGCGVADTNTDGDSAPDCTDQCDADPAKTAPGACGCGVADTNRDGDSAPDCTDECDDNPARTTPGPCGCTECVANPLAGTYAIRTVSFSKQRDGSSILTSKSLGYSLATITENADRSLTLSERGCWTQSLPKPGDAQQAYSWSKPAWVQALPVGVQTLTANANGTYTRTIPLTPLGWNPARQPSSCSTSSTPVQPWPSGWGASCRCNTPASALPPYDTNAAPYDCRLVDIDGDGQPGMSAIAATSPPSSPEASAPAIGGTAYAAINGRGSWLITPASNRRHTATIDDQSEAQVVGCSGLACGFLPATPPGNRACPQAVNRAQFIPATTSSDSCAEIIAQRDTLFDASQDPAWPDNAACPPP
jgi:hypothetical protein